MLNYRAPVSAKLNHESQTITKATGVDCLVFVTCYKQISEAKQKAYLSAAVVDGSGTVIWYCVKGWKGEPGLTDPVAVAEIGEKIVSCFPQRLQ